MDRDSIYAGAAFRAVLLAGMVFVAVLIGAGFAAYAYVQDTLIVEERRQITTELQLLGDVHRESGTAGLIVALDALGPSLSLTRRAAGLFRTDGTRLAGNITQDPGIRGFARAPVHLRLTGLEPAPAAHPFFLGLSQVEGLRIVVGRSLETVHSVERRVMGGIVLFGAVVMLAALGIGYALSQASQRKLDTMAEALDAVSRGEMGARIPVPRNGGAPDQIDRIALQMNGHLERLSRLMAEARTTAAAIAHDLRTPLSRAFLGLERAALDLDAGRDAAPALAEAQEDLSRLNAIVDTVLRIARISADAQPLRAVALAPLLRDMAETFAPMAEDAGQILTLGPLEEVSVMGDAGMLRQALANLLQNAITHAGAGAAITLGAKAGPEGVTLSLCDNGPGVPAHDRARLCEPFFRADAARQTAGSGLGLALIHAVAERHGARLSLEDARPGLCARLLFPDAGVDTLPTPKTGTGSDPV